MDNCPVHNVPFKLVPAGVSKKTGKGYPAFYTCPTFGCLEKPPKDEWESAKQDFESAVEPTKAPTKAETQDNAIWDAKDRMNMAQSALKAAAEIVAAQITMVPSGASVDFTKTFDDLKEKNYKWLVDKKEGK